MRSGTDYHEGGAGTPHYQLNRMDRGWGHLLSESTDAAAARHALSLRQWRRDPDVEPHQGAHGRARRDAFADLHLFAQLDITDFRWGRKRRRPSPHGWGACTCDLATWPRFGLLYLRGGRWGDTQVVPADWGRALDPVTRRVLPHRAAQDDRVRLSLVDPLSGPRTAPANRTIYAAMGFPRPVHLRGPGARHGRGGPPAARETGAINESRSSSSTATFSPAVREDRGGR